jgi:D-alanyl-D-alanine carboxypeptidase
MHLPESKPRPANWKVVLTSPIILAALLFPAGAYAVDPSPSPSPSVSASPSVSPTPDVSPSPSPSPEVSVDPMPVIYDIDTASSPSVVVNKKRPLNPKTYIPANLKKYPGSSVKLAAPARDALVLMAAAMKKAGAGTLVLNSGYRSYASQKIIHAAKVSQLGLKAGEALAARPGYSEHQTGLAADVSAYKQGCAIYTCFSATKAGKWLAENAWQYGFVIRYPYGQTKITGYQFEPWHLRFIGLEIATDMRAKNILTVEKYFSLPNAPKY